MTEYFKVIGRRALLYYIPQPSANYQAIIRKEPLEQIKWEVMPYRIVSSPNNFYGSFLKTYTEKVANTASIFNAAYTSGSVLIAYD